MKRRNVLVGGGLVALAGGWQVFGVRRPELTFRNLRGATGWRFAALGGVSGARGADLMTIGLQSGPPPLPADRLDQVVHRDGRAGTIQVSVFSDFFCPYCRGLIGRLTARSATPEISISWHELPLLGPPSVLAARAAEAAALQGGYSIFYAQLLRDGFRASPVWMGDVAAAAGLDGTRLRRDMEGPDVEARLLESARAAKTLGFVGTPGMAIERSAILGALDADQIEDLIAAAA